VRGREVAVNTFTWDGHTSVVDVWEYRRPTGEDYDQPYWDVVRLAPDDPDWAAATRFAVDVVDAFGIRIGPGHTEVKLSPRGPVLIEVASRLPGAHMTDHWARHSNADPYDGVLDAHLGNHPGPLATAVEFTSSTAVCCITHDGPPGLLRAVHGLAEAERLPGVDEVFLGVAPGTHVHPTTGLDSVVALVLVSGPDTEAVDKTIRSVRDTIRLDVS
jgi:biotin carboxylase